MTPFTELTGREMAAELLRWILVLPAAALGGLAVRYASVLASRLAEYGWGAATESAFVYYLQFGMFHVLKEAAFVIAGAKVAPRSRPVTAIALAVAGILMSLVVHELGQPHPGSTKTTPTSPPSPSGLFWALLTSCTPKKIGRAEVATSGAAMATSRRNDWRLQAKNIRRHGRHRCSSDLCSRDES